MHTTQRTFVWESPQLRRKDARSYTGTVLDDLIDIDDDLIDIDDSTSNGERNHKANNEPRNSDVGSSAGISLGAPILNRNNSHNDL